MARQKLRLPEIGDVWGNRLVVGEVYKHWKTSRQYVKTECVDCGLIKDVRVDAGRGRSCTCVIPENRVIHGNSRVGYHTRLYNIWCGVKSRCDNSNNDSYRWYGRKGIKYCEEWQEFIPFKIWALANGYQDDLVIDRIDSSMDYSPLNCRWITQSENVRRTY